MKPVTTEKAIMMIERDNILTFIVDKRLNKVDIKKKIEELFDVKVRHVRIQIKDNKKRAYIQLKKDFPAIDIATKLGFM